MDLTQIVSEQQHAIGELTNVNGIDNTDMYIIYFGVAVAFIMGSLVLIDSLADYFHKKAEDKEPEEYEQK